jgi:hypothetical protein
VFNFICSSLQALDKLHECLSKHDDNPAQAFRQALNARVMGIEKFKSDFEQEIANGTQEYYQRKAIEWLSCKDFSFSDYLKKVRVSGLVLLISYLFPTILTLLHGQVQRIKRSEEARLQWYIREESQRRQLMQEIVNLLMVAPMESQKISEANIQQVIQAPVGTPLLFFELHEKKKMIVYLSFLGFSYTVYVLISSFIFCAIFAQTRRSFSTFAPVIWPRSF